MAKLNSTKLLPPSKSSSALVVRPTIKEKKTKISSALVKSSKVGGPLDANNKLVKIEKFFESDLIKSKKEAEKKRKEEERQDFDKAEKKLELPKISGFKLPKLFDAPKTGFLDRVKRFLFFTALGWLVPKIIEFLPKLEGVAKIIGKVAGFAGDIFGKLLNGFTTFVSAGIDLKTKTLGFIAQSKEGNYQKTFDNLEKQFNKFTDLSIIAGLLAVDIGAAAIDEINKQRRGQKPSKPSAEERRPGKPPVTTGRGGQKGLGRGVKITQGKGGKVPSWWNKILKGPFAKLKGPLSRFAGAAVPGLGAAVGAADAALRFKAGDKIGGTLASVSATLDGAAFASALTGIGLPVAGVLTAISMGIDVLLLINDVVKVIKELNPVLRWIPTFNRGGRIVNSYQKGGTTRGGKPVGAPKRRTYTPSRRRVFKAPPQKTQPGKNVGGLGKIKKLYPDTDTKKAAMSIEEWNESGKKGTYSEYLKEQKQQDNEERPNPYLALTSTSKILKRLSLESGRIPGVQDSKNAVGYLMNGIGGLMGAAVDAALGQKIDSKIPRSFSSGIGYLVDTLVNQRVNSRISAISGFANGGKVAPTRELRSPNESLNTGDLIEKVIGPSIQQRINEAIQSVQKEVRKKVKEEEEETAGGGPGGGGGGGGIESIDISGLSAEDVDALGRMVHAESGGERDIGKAAVLAVILNRYRLIKSGKVRPGEFSVVNKPKENITIRDIIFARGQFSPMDDGSFARASSSSGRTALASAIRMGGNDPQKLRENLIRVGKLNEADADYVVRSTFFSAPNGRTTIPGGRAREVIIGGHSFQQSGSSRLLGRMESFQATVMDGIQSSGLEIVGGTRPSTMVPTSYQGWRWGRMHKGVDLSAGLGTPISSSQDALVVFAGDTGGGYGNEVVLRYSNGAEARFAHFQKFGPGVRTRNKIKAGQIIGYEGSSGRSTGPHLHFEYYPRGGAMTYQGYGNALSVVDRYFRYGGNVRVRVPSKPMDNANNEQRSSRQPPARQQGSSQLRSNSIQNVLAALAKKDEYFPFEHEGKRFVFKVFPNLSIVAWPATSFNNKLPNPLPVFGGRRIESTSAEFKRLIPSIREKINSMYTLPPAEGKKSGGLIAPSKPNRSIPNSFASYETYGSGMMIAIQPIIIEKTVPVRSEKMIVFPVAVAVNSNNNLSLSRG